MRQTATWQNPAILQNPAVVLVALVLITLALYYGTVAGLVRFWTDPDNSAYQHGLPLVAICAFLFYRRWVELKGSGQMRPSLSASVLVMLASFGWLLASLANSQTGQWLTLILVVGLVVASVVGYRSAGVLDVPLSLLIFALPVWEPLNPYLQELTAHVVTALLNLTGLPALLEGTLISVPAGIFDVRPACAGVGQVMIGTMVGTVFTCIRRLTFPSAVCVIAAAAGVSVLTNTLRIYITVIIGQLSGMHEYAFIKHWAPGWTLFGIGMLIFLVLADRLTRPVGRAGGTLSAATDASRTVGQRARLVYSASLSFGALALAPAFLYVHHSDSSERVPTPLKLPTEIGDWRAEMLPSSSYRPVFHDPDVEYERVYRDAQGGRVYLYVAEYTYQEEGKLAIRYENKVYDDNVWKWIVTRTRNLDGTNTVAETRIQTTTGAQKLVWQWYYVHGSAVSNAQMAKLLNIWGKLNHDPAIAVVVVAADLGRSHESVDGLLTRFVTDTRPALEHALDHIRAP
jgi:EpsI family protein